MAPPLLAEVAGMRTLSAALMAWAVLVLIIAILIEVTDEQANAPSHARCPPHRESSI